MTESVSSPPPAHAALARAQCRAYVPTPAALGAHDTAERDRTQRRIMLAVSGEAARPWETAGRIRSFCEHSPFRPRDIAEIEVCVVEALEYALGRGHRRLGAEVVLVATFTGAALSIELTHFIHATHATHADDAGPALDSRVPAVRVTLERGSRSRTGGLPLTHRVMDEVSVHTHEGRCTLSFVRHLPRALAGETR